MSPRLPDLSITKARFGPIADRAHAVEPPRRRRYAMQHPSDDTRAAAAKVPWNKGKIIGARPPLQTKHVWAIRTKLQLESKKRDLAMFNLAIDSKLDRKSTRLNSSHMSISYAVFCLKKKKKK